MNELDEFDRLELSEYTPRERAEMFIEAIHDMASKGIITAKTAKQLLTNIERWLLEEMEN